MSNPFAVLVGGRSWEWLRELCRPLGFQAQLLDQAHVALLPPDGLGAVFSLRDLIAGPKLPLLAAVTAALQTKQLQTVAVNGADVVCAPLTLDGRAQGVLVVARPPNPAGPVAVSAQQLTTVSTWLAGAVERHLSSASVGPDNLAALHKVLQHVVQEGSDRDLVAVFAEALALWHDIEVVGYVETAPGVFVRAASLAGRIAPDRPIVFPPQALPPALKVTRIPQADIDGMDADGSREVLVTTLSRTSGNGTWLLTMAGAIDGCDPQVLGNYVSALDMAVALAAAASRTRVAMLLSHRLSASPSEGGNGIEGALDALREAVSAQSAALAVDAGGRQVLYHVGSGGAFAKPGEPRDRPRIAVRRTLAERQDITLGLARTDDRHFTPLEYSLALVAAELLGDWVATPAVTEAGESGAVFGRTIERLASEALERGMAVTAVVVATGNASPTAQALVDELRRQMRQSDVVGLLQPGEVGLLLPDTTAAHANAVARRLRSALGATHSTNSSVRTIGFATRIPGQGAANGILRDARANAQGRSNGHSHAAAS